MLTRGLLRLEVKTPRNQNGDSKSTEMDTSYSVWISPFDFPMIDNTRLPTVIGKAWVLTPGQERFCSRLLLLHLSARIQVIEIENRVENEKVAARSLSAPEWVVREEHDVAALEWRIDHSGVLSDFIASIQ